MKNVLWTLLLCGACASTKPETYQRMRTVNEALTNQKHISNGMAMTDDGSVVDLKVEEVGSQKKILEARVEYLERLNRMYREDNSELKAKNAELRIHLGLRAEPARREWKGTDSNGRAVWGPPVAATVDDELAAK